MALNETPARVTHYSISFLIEQDGDPGNTMTLHNSDLIGLLEAFHLGGPLHELLVHDIAPPGNAQAIQRALLLGDASGMGGAIDLSNIPHCEVSVEPQTVDHATPNWCVDANVDGNNAARGQLDIIGPAQGISTCLVTIEFRHSRDR